MSRSKRPRKTSDALPRLASLLRCQIAERRRHMAVQLDMERLPPAPVGETTSYLQFLMVPITLRCASIDGVSFRVRGCSRSEFRRWTAGNVKLLLPPRQSRGV